MSIVLMVNEKWRERVPLWTAFQQKPDTFPDFFHCLLEACLSSIEVCVLVSVGDIIITSCSQGGKLSMRERSVLIIFLVHAFNSLVM
jgi:intron-binding protein aquarius